MISLEDLHDKVIGLEVIFDVGSILDTNCSKIHCNLYKTVLKWFKYQ